MAHKYRGQQLDARTESVKRDCEHCQAWVPKGNNLGQCRRHPPNAGIMRATEHGPLMAFPITNSDDFCEDFKP